MPRDDLVEVEGVILDAMGGGKYKVKTSDSEVIAQLSGRLRRNHIRVVPGDRVRVALSPYDLTNGLISFRLK